MRASILAANRPAGTAAEQAEARRNSCRATPDITEPPEPRGSPNRTPPKYADQPNPRVSNSVLTPDYSRDGTRRSGLETDDSEGEREERADREERDDREEREESQEREDREHRDREHRDREQRERERRERERTNPMPNRHSQPDPPPSEIVDMISAIYALAKTVTKPPVAEFRPSARLQTVSLDNLRLSA